MAGFVSSGLATSRSRMRHATTHDSLSRFGTPEVIKLLSCVDEDMGFERGSIGQSVEAIVSSLPEGAPILASISEDSSLPVFTRECAAFIGSMKERRTAMSSGEDWRVQAQRILRGG